MRPLNTTEKNRLIANQTETMFDEVQIGVYGETVDGYGDVIKTWTYGANVDAGVTILNGYERVNGVMTYTGVIARIRLPIDTVISSKDKIKFGGVAYGVKSVSGKYSLVVDCEGVS